MRPSQRPQISVRSVEVFQSIRREIRDCKEAPSLQIYRIHNASKYYPGVSVIIPDEDQLTGHTEGGFLFTEHGADIQLLVNRKEKAD